ncbi:type I polyketide synthase [Mycobacterium sp. 050134]|uniref:type I polyketide synthase n=1 Tax=Mycobacterium sp. 050134 TaxID=3096111 RepID=UPI002EDBB0D2
MPSDVRPEDVAVVGVACRFPGAAGPDEFWQLIRDGLEASRLTVDPAGFDADFFNVSPREARAMDPRQRLALELAWELLEDAFVLPETFRGQQVSVHLGAMTDDYAVLTLRDPDGLDHHSFTGISRAMIANRVSYAFGLHGPSMTVDSGQSSSLVAVHLACAGLRAGTSTLAIAGGVHLNLAAETAALERQFGAMSSSGHTFAFDRRADGYVRGEGGGLVLLKPLRDALDAGDRIRAVIRGGAVGNAGHNAGGQTAPSVSGQADVIRRALADAGIDGDAVDYVEAHGTGTRAGDPAEAEALGRVFAGHRRRPLRLGSVKTNIGHTGAAAGIAGLIKAVLALENGAIPPTPNFADPVSGLDGLGLEVGTAVEPWPAGEAPRCAGVSSFGMGGTNAHMIVADPPVRPAPAQTVGALADPEPAVAWVVTARSARSLADQAERLAQRVAGVTAPRAGDVAWSLATTRTRFEHRAVLVGRDRQALTQALAELSSGRATADTATGVSREAGKTVFVFPGQGAQRLGMGAGLYARFPEFARAFDEAAAALDGRLRRPVRDVMWSADGAALDDTEFAQPALFAVEVALTALLRHWGMVPDAVLGHSVGEITAAHVAGVLSLPDAARLVAARGRLMAGLPAGGAMVAVAAGEAEVTPLLPDGVSIAAVNGPDAVVLSGAEADVGAVAERLTRRGRRVHRLAVSHAFHSALIEPMIDEFAAAVADITPSPARIPLMSNVSGLPAGADYGSAQYWARHARAAVRFADGVRAAEALGAGAFVEVGPGGGLDAAVEQALTTPGPVAVATLPKDRPEPEAVLAAAARLFVTGTEIDWAAALEGGNRVALPTYAFERQRFWLGDGPDPAPPGAPDLAVSLREAEPGERRRRLIDLVRTHAAAVLGHPDGRGVDAGRAFQDLGFDSMGAVELRNRVAAATGLTLSRTAIFDYPNPTALAEHVGQQLLAPRGAETDDEKIRDLLLSIPVGELRDAGLLDKLLLLAGDRDGSFIDPVVDDDDIDSLSPDALIALALNGEDPNDAG